MSFPGRQRPSPTLCSRRQFLRRSAAAALLLALSDSRVLGADDCEVPWLDEVQQPSRDVPHEAAGHLEPLLVSADGERIDTLAEWKQRRTELRRRWLNFLGPMPEERPPVVLKVLEEDRPDGCLRQLVQYEGEPELLVEGYLLRPDHTAERKLPGIVGLHQTTRNSIEEIAGVQGPESMQIGLKLCRRGFVVFCPRCFLWQDVDQYQDAVARFKKRHPDTLVMHKMLYDAMRGVDVLASLPEVDPERIGAAGHSLGAKEALYLGAFDERVKAAVASEGGLTFRSTNWDAPWYLGERIRDESFPLNHHQLVALIAPRAFLVLGGESGPGAADGDRSWPLIEAALPVYRLYGERPRLGLYNHRQGHSIPPKAFERMAEWLECYLGRGSMGDS